MIKFHNKWKLLAVSGKDFIAEVNWNEEDGIKDCKVIRFTFPDGTQSVIKREHLHEILFSIGTEEQQRELIPQIQTEVEWYETVVGVKATKNIAKGEMMNFPIKISLPARKKEVIGKIPKSIHPLIK